MPIYEFECPKHGRFEVFKLSVPESDKLACPRVLAPGGNLEGDGFQFPTILCGEVSQRVEFSLPAKRNPAHGYQV